MYPSSVVSWPSGTHQTTHWMKLRNKVLSPIRFRGDDRSISLSSFNLKNGVIRYENKQVVWVQALMVDTNCFGAKQLCSYKVWTTSASCMKSMLSKTWSMAAFTRYYWKVDSRCLFLKGTQTHSERLRHKNFVFTKWNFDSNVSAI